MATGNKIIDTNLVQNIAIGVNVPMRRWCVNLAIFIVGAQHIDGSQQGNISNTTTKGNE